MELSSPKLKKLLYFSKKNFFLYLGKWNFPVPSLKNYYIFLKKVFLMFLEGTSQRLKTKNSTLKKFVMFF